MCFGRMRDLHEAERGECRRRGMQLDAQGRCIDDLGRLDRDHEGVPERRLPLQQVVEGELGVLDGDGLAVVPFHAGTQLQFVGGRIDQLVGFRRPRLQVELAVVAQERVVDEAQEAAPVGRPLGEGMRGAHPEGRRDIHLLDAAHGLELEIGGDVIQFEAERLRRLEIPEELLVHRVDGVARADVPGRQVLGENALRLVDQRLPLRRIDFLLLSLGDPVEFRIAVVRGVEAAARAENGAQIEVGIEPLLRRTEAHHRGHDILAAVHLAEDLTEGLRLVVDLRCRARQARGHRCARPRR